MKILHLVLMVALVSFSRMAGQAQLVDRFSANDAEVQVFFYDPFTSFTTEHPDYSQLAGAEQLLLWRQHLKKKAVYMMKVSVDQSDSVFYFVLRGDPANTKSSRFYHVQVIAGDGFDLTDPNQQKYTSRIITTIPAPNIRAGFFEDSLPADMRGQLAGKDFLLFPDQFVYVNPYKAIKDTMIPILDRYTHRNSSPSNK